MPGEQGASTSDVTCPLCQGPLAPCQMLSPHAGGKPTIYGLETEFFSLSGRKHQSDVEQRVCVDCGYLLTFAVTPGVFREALGGEKAIAAGLPIPHQPPEERSSE